MKKLLAFLLVFCMAFALAGCDLLDGSTKTEATDEGYSSVVESSDDASDDSGSQPQEETEDHSYTQPHTHSVYICRSFVATGCAQITDLRYDDYGYPSGGSYECYCPTCGKRLGGGGFSSSLNASGYCFDCKKNWPGEIKGVFDWIEVED